MILISISIFQLINQSILFRLINKILWIIQNKRKHMFRETNMIIPMNKNLSRILIFDFDLQLVNTSPNPIIFRIKFFINSNKINQSSTFRNKESQSPLPAISPRSLPFSTRLLESSSTNSLPTTEHDLNTTALSKRSSRENISNHVQARSTPSSPNIIPSLMQLQTSPMKASKGDGLSLIHSNHFAENEDLKIILSFLVVPYQHERNTSELMICNQNSIILFRSQADRLTRWCSIIFDRSNPNEKESKWHNLCIKSIGFINQTNIYIFTEREFLTYSSDLSSKYYSRILLNDNNYNSEYNNIHLGFGGTVHEQYIYHIYLNIKYHWILSILEVETINHIYDHDLTESFPNVQRFIDICINNRIISFLVEMDGSQYAVMFCTNHINSKLELKRFIQLSYAENPLTICSVYIHYIQKDIYFINDPSAKIIHLLTQEKYLQSYSIIVHTLCYVEDTKELILTSNDGLYSININEQHNFFSKFH